MADFNAETIPDVADVREGLLESLEKHRVALLAVIAIAVIGSLGLLSWSAVQKDRMAELRAEYHAIVDAFETGDTLYAQAGGDFVGNPQVALAQNAELEALLDKCAGTDLEPLVLFQMALRYQVAGDDAAAKPILARLQSEFKESGITQVQSFDSATTSLVGRMEGLSAGREQFEAAHPYVRPVADPATVALVETDLGDLRIAFYRDQAPKHVDAFIRHAKAGDFNGTSFFNVRPGNLIEGGGGDRTRDTDPMNDRRDDPGLALPPESAARHGIRHERGMITSVPLLSGDQSDRFAVVLGADPVAFDSVRTPFGEILNEEGRGVADRIANAQTYKTSPLHAGSREANLFANTPYPAVRIRRVSIWTDGAMDGDHAWDTARVGTADPEPTPEGEDDEEAGDFGDGDEGMDDGTEPGDDEESGEEE